MKHSAAIRISADHITSLSYEVRHHAAAGCQVRVVESSTAVYRSTVPTIGSDQGDQNFDWHWLRAKAWPTLAKSRGRLAVADLFCGSGGLTLGAWEAARAIELKLDPVFAIDNDPDAIKVYNQNFAPRHSHSSSLEDFVDGGIGMASTANERALSRRLDRLDLLLAGPPCQGHSDLNNHTRRNDPRNELILRVVRFAELFCPTHVIIENVQGVRHDRAGVFQRTEQHLQKLGYETASFLLEGQGIGVAQRRRRCFLLGSLKRAPDLGRILRANGTPERSFDWACGDLEKATGGVFDTPARVYPDNQRRMEYLIGNNVYDLPDSERPDCHRLKEHDYRAVYGRLYPDVPAPTITTGFGSPGQGRFTHPRAPRTITPHEAARLQFIPDFFVFDLSKRKRLQKLIGNSVPPKMAYAAALDLICHE